LLKRIEDINRGKSTRNQKWRAYQSIDEDALVSPVKVLETNRTLEHVSEFANQPIKVNSKIIT